jgi:hypothetical protein
MKSLLVLLALLPSLANADLFNCDSLSDEHLHVLVQNNVDPLVGTRTAELLTVTDTATSEALINSTKILQNGAFWTVDTRSYTSDASVQVGDFDRKVLSQVQVYLPSFNFNENNKDQSHYTGYLLLYKNGETQTPAQSVELECIYSWEKSI